MVIFSILVLFAGLSTAASVSIDSYTKSCTKCAFDAGGKMNNVCWEEIQDGAKTSLGIAYPAMSFQYTLGDGCQALDQCVNALTTCKSLYTSGNDLQDCNSGDLVHCFIKADLCAEAANKMCTQGKGANESGLTDLISNMTSPNNDPSADNVIVMGEDDPPWLCMSAPFIMGFLIMGAFFATRR